jgi:hypothetical protein
VHKSGGPRAGYSPREMLRQAIDSPTPLSTISEIPSRASPMLYLDWREPGKKEGKKKVKIFLRGSFGFGLVWFVGCVVLMVRWLEKMDLIFFFRD